MFPPKQVYVVSMTPIVLYMDQHVSVFIDLTKAFDTISWNALAKLVLSSLLAITQPLHEDGGLSGNRAIHFPLQLTSRLLRWGADSIELQPIYISVRTEHVAVSARWKTVSGRCHSLVNCGSEGTSSSIAMWELHLTSAYRKQGCLATALVKKFRQKRQGTTEQSGEHRLHLELYKTMPLIL